MSENVFDCRVSSSLPEGALWGHQQRHSLSKTSGPSKRLVNRPPRDIIDRPDTAIVQTGSASFTVEQIGTAVNKAFPLAAKHKTLVLIANQRGGIYSRTYKPSVVSVDLLTSTTLKVDNRSVQLLDMASRKPAPWWSSESTGWIPRRNSARPISELRCVHMARFTILFSIMSGFSALSVGSGVSVSQAFVQRACGYSQSEAYNLFPFVTSLSHSITNGVNPSLINSVLIEKQENSRIREAKVRNTAGDQDLSNQDAVAIPHLHTIQASSVHVTFQVDLNTVRCTAVRIWYFCQRTESRSMFR
ncbi:hypothetical protein V1524DRAFT_418205 [Lipomyces starkeyi]